MVLFGKGWALGIPTGIFLGAIFAVIVSLVLSLPWWGALLMVMFGIIAGWWMQVLCAIYGYNHTTGSRPKIL
jgi:ABC-type uncharacterized transport system permease subunit